MHARHAISGQFCHSTSNYTAAMSPSDPPGVDLSSGGRSITLRSTVSACAAATLFECNLNVPLAHSGCILTTPLQNKLKLTWENQVRAVTMLQCQDVQRVRPHILCRSTKCQVHSPQVTYITLTLLYGSLLMVCDICTAQTSLVCLLAVLNAKPVDSKLEHCIRLPTAECL